jgi:hypothetical protein
MRRRNQRPIDPKIFDFERPAVPSIGIGLPSSTQHFIFHTLSDQERAYYEKCLADLRARGLGEEAAEAGARDRYYEQKQLAMPASRPEDSGQE